MPMEAVTAPMTPAPIARPVRVRVLLSFSAKGCLPVSHERDAVDLLFVDAHLVVQVASRGRSRGADPGDGLARAHGLADPDQDAAVADVRVSGLDAAAVVDQHEVAVAAVRARVDDRSVVRRIDRRVARGAD